MTTQPKQPAISPIACLLLSNGLFWGGLFGLDWIHGRWSSQGGRQQQIDSAHRSVLHAEQQADQLLGLVTLDQTPSRSRVKQEPGLGAERNALTHASADVLAPLASADGQGRRGTAAVRGNRGHHGVPSVSFTQTNFTQISLTQQLRRADGLGGLITLESLDEPAMPAAARAERLAWQRSSDPLSPLPLHWRDRIKQDVPSKATLGRAEVIRLPVPAAVQREEIALLIDESGAAIGLQKPEQKPVVAAVEAWASRQEPAPSGTVHAVVIAAEPMPVNAGATTAEPALAQ